MVSFGGARFGKKDPYTLQLSSSPSSTSELQQGSRNQNRSGQKLPKSQSKKLGRIPFWFSRKDSTDPVPLAIQSGCGISHTTPPSLCSSMSYLKVPDVVELDDVRDDASDVSFEDVFNELTISPREPCPISVKSTHKYTWGASTMTALDDDGWPSDENSESECGRDNGDTTRYDMEETLSGYNAEHMETSSDDRLTTEETVQSTQLRI